MPLHYLTKYQLISLIPYIIQPNVHYYRCEQGASEEVTAVKDVLARLFKELRRSDPVESEDSLDIDGSSPNVAPG